LSNSKALLIGLAAALLLAAGPAPAQVYSWKDPATGQSKFSNVPPSWYSRGEIVSGPRVIATVGRKVIDDTALPYEDRLLLSGKPRDTIDKLRLQQQPQASATQDQDREPARTQGNISRPADKTATR
jgi:hypothetical protein